MTSSRVLVVVVALLIAAAGPARAQARWGGGGPGVSPSQRGATHAHVVYRGPVLTAPSAPMDGQRRVRLEGGGGSWDGRRPTAGGSPPERTVPTESTLDGFFGYVPPRGQVINQTPPAVQPVLRTRDAYAARRARP